MLKSILSYPNIPCGNDPFFAKHTNYFSENKVNIHYHYRTFGKAVTISCIVAVFVVIWLYGRKIRKNELPKV